MPDPIDQNLQPTTTPPSTPPPADLPNPQEMVDKVLGQTPAASEELPLAFAPPATPPTATPTPTPVSDSAPSPLPGPTPPPAAPEIPSNPPPAVEQPAVLPPPVSEPMPAPSPVLNTPVKKKSKVGVVIAGILFLVLALGGGITGYMYYNTGRIPEILCSSNDERGFCAGPNANQAEYGGYAGGGTGSNSNAYIGSDVEKAGQIQAIADSAAQAAREAGGDADAARAAILNAGGSGNDVAAAQTAANAIKDNLAENPGAGQFGSTNGTTETVGGKTYPFIAGTYIAPDGKRYLVQSPGTYDAAVRYYYANGQSIPDLSSTIEFPPLDQFNDPLNAGRTWVPPGVGCYATGSTSDTGNSQSAEGLDNCKQWHWTTCISGKGMNGVGCDVVAKQEGNGETTYTLATSPTMACTGITRTPITTPVVGSVLTFTCAGTVTPSTAGTLSYKFRYSLNSAATVAMTNKTATTAELTINACGTYKVQCQACATLDGVLTCDPSWTGATQ